jgi:hypothetical protein
VANNFSLKLQRDIEAAVLSEVKDKRWTEYESIYSGIKKEELDELFPKTTWSPAVDWALLQAEEIFCDFFGLRLFAESYLYAFAYLVSPGTLGLRSMSYPNMRKRVELLLWASEQLGIAKPTAFMEQFRDSAEPDDVRMKFLVSIADSVSVELKARLIEYVQNVSTQKDLAIRVTANVEAIRKTYAELVVPTKHPQTLTDILNAGWACAMDEHLWKETPLIPPEDRDRILKDLMLKSMEVSEIHDKWSQAQ